MGLIQFINELLNPGGQQTSPTPSFYMVSSKVIRGKKSIFKWLVEKKKKKNLILRHIKRT